MIVCALRVPRRRWAAKYACLTMGVYLIHPLVTLGLMACGPVMGSVWVLFPATVVVSTVAVAWMKRTPYLRAIV